MKKKLAIIALAVVMALPLTGCNKQVFDMTYSYDYAIIELPDGTIVEGKVQSWNDYEGEQLQVKIDGIEYLTSSFHCTLINTHGNEIPRSNEGN